MGKTTNKIISYDGLGSILSKIKEKNKVLVGGCFDIVHYGHLRYLTKSKELGDILIVALETDEFIISRKKRQPIHTQQERAEILAGFSMVDYVIILPYFTSDKEYEEMVKKIEPAVIAAVQGDPQSKNMQKQAQVVGGKFKIVMSKVKEFSTSAIVNHALISSH